MSTITIRMGEKVAGTIDGTGLTYRDRNASLTSGVKELIGMLPSNGLGNARFDMVLGNGVTLVGCRVLGGDLETHARISYSTATGGSASGA